MRFCFLLLIFTVFFSCQKKTNVNVLHHDVPCVSLQSDIKLSQLMSDSFLITPLETIDKSILGRINKIKKYKGEFYILSNDQWIFHFDEKGKYVSSLRKRGNAPDEYTYINDFDIYDIDGINQIWIADNQSIKIYNVDDLIYQREINFPFIVSKFKRLAKDEILIMNGTSDNSLFVVKETGEVVNEYLKKEIPYLLLRSIQFKNYSSNLCLFQLGISNDFVSYNIDSKNFDSGIFFDEEEMLISKKGLKELFEKKGQNFIMNFKDYKYIQSYFNLGNSTWFYIHDKEKKYMSKIVSGTSCVSVILYPENNLNNDLFDSNHFDFLTTLGFGESDNSLLLYMDVSSFADSMDSLSLKSGQCLSIKEDDNPFIIEFF
ncbi:MAG: 6-bladed beta-propeller [Parabacteroides distasonis]|nr:6-bladed beta-propeller [Parabacteroides distasonis]